MIMSFITYRRSEVDTSQFVTTIIAAVAHTKAKCTFGIDVSDWQDEKIRMLIEGVRDGLPPNSTRLLGIRAGGDVVMKLGGIKEYINARLEGNVPVVAVAEFGMMELVFKP
jgi:hypothetical protein